MLAGAALAKHTCSRLWMRSNVATAAVTIAATIQHSTAAQASQPGHHHRQLSSSSSSSKGKQLVQQPVAMSAAYWRSLLHSATKRPAALLVGTAAVSAGVWAAQAEWRRGHQLRPLQAASSSGSAGGGSEPSPSSSGSSSSSRPMSAAAAGTDEEGGDSQ